MAYWQVTARTEDVLTGTLEGEGRTLAKRGLQSSTHPQPKARQWQRHGLAGSQLQAMPLLCAKVTDKFGLAFRTWQGREIKIFILWLAYLDPK